VLGQGTRSRGQATTEHILIVVLVAIRPIGVITAFGNQVRGPFRVAIERLGGVSDSKPDSAIARSARNEVHKSLSSLKE